MDSKDLIGPSAGCHKGLMNIFILLLLDLPLVIFAGNGPGYGISGGKSSLMKKAKLDLLKR